MGVFDGMTGIAAAILGGPVIYTPQGGAARSIQSIGRRKPVEVIGPDGTSVLLTAPTWRVRADLVPELSRGDLVSFDGQTYRVLNQWPQGSSATDAHVVCELDPQDAGA